MTEDYADPLKNTIAWEVADTLNGLVVETKYNGIPLGSPRRFTTREEVDAAIEYDRLLFHAAQRQVAKAAAGLGQPTGRA